MTSRLLCALLLTACTRTETVTRTLNQHVTGACPIPPDTVGKYLATGDFQPLASNLAQQPLQTDQAETLDGVPGNVQSLTVAASAPDLSSWLGATLVPPAGDADMLLLPASSACTLNGNSPGIVSRMVFAAVSPKTMIASGAPDSNNNHPSYRVDLGTGRVSKMSNGLGKYRTNAAVAALGDGRALVIGGLSNSITLTKVEIFDESVGDFVSTTFDLQSARSDHGAVALAGGDVFVAGGQDSSGRIAATERIHFDGTLWRTNQGSTPNLADPRTNPYVLRLADSTLLVGGGFDASGPASTIEFFSPNANAALDSTTVLSPNGNNAFVALDGGGALMVDADGTGSPAQHAWFVLPKQVAIPIQPDVSAPITKPVLFPRAGGGALIWTGSAWWTFDPWSGCAPLAKAPSTGPGVDSPVAFGEAGLRSWIDASGNVMVWRDSVRNAFATDGPYLVTDTSLMTPDRLPAPAFSNLALTLDSTTAAFVADARYLDVAVDLDVPVNVTPAHVVIRGPNGEVEVGGAGCGLAPKGRVHVERTGAFVTYSQGGALLPCKALDARDANARVAVGVRGNGVAQNLVVTRLGAALP